MPSPNQAVQEEELEILRSIFADDWHDIAPKRTAWGTETDEGWWEVTLRGEDERVSVGLRGRFTKMYPDQPPVLSLVDPTFLSATHTRTLLKLLQDKAKASVGGQMVFDLADYAKDWISHNHLPLPKSTDHIPTLMEEMARREEEKKAHAAAQSQVEKEQQLARAAEQTRLLNEKIHHDAVRKEERTRQVLMDEAEQQRLASVATLADGELEVREITLDDEITVDGFDGSWKTFMLFGGKKEKLWTSYTGEPVEDGTVNPDFVKASLPTVEVQVIDFAAGFYSTAQGRRKVDGVVNEIQRLREVSSKHVQRILGLTRGKSPKGWERVVVVLEKPGDAVKIRTWVGDVGLGEALASEYMGQILQGLADLHEKGICQRLLDLESVYLCSAPEGNTVKLAGTSYARRLLDLHRSNPFLKNHSETLPDAWKSPDEAENLYAYTSKRDMWYAGVLLAQMIWGQKVVWKFYTPATLLQQAHVADMGSDALAAVLNGLLEPNHKKRLPAIEALQMLRSGAEITRTITRHSNHSHSLSSSVQFAPLASPLAQALPPHMLDGPFGSTNTLARYRKEFEEVEFLGKGGFGEVVKARHLQDGRAYAIKKVRLRPEDNEVRVLREVNTLSGLNHINIVRYFSCWLEDVAPPPVAVEAVESSSSVSTPQAASPEDSDPFAPPKFDDPSLWKRDTSRSTSFPRIRFADSDEDDSEEEDSGASSDTSSAETVDASQPVERGRSMVKPSVSVSDATTEEGHPRRILYIQMEFVENQTLREAIAAGLSDDDAWRIFGQILQALAYLSHEKSVVHRDLKPANILLDAHGNAKVSDFGLATTGITAIENHPDQHTSLNPSERTSGIGTSLYIAPEVAASRSYDTKVDMYSLGIIFFEMCYPFKTGMERIQILSALRQPSVTFPEGWGPNFKPEQKEIISMLLRHDPSKRPDAKHLLLSPLVPSQEKDEIFYERAINELTNPTSRHHQALLDAMFDPDAHAYTMSYDDRPDDYTYDREADDSLQVWLSVVIKRLEDLFQRHGAVDTNLPLLMPETSLLKAFPDLKPVRVLDVKGKVVLLPFSDILHMARSVTRRQIERIKRYHIGHRYANHPTMEGQPVESGDISFDIISPLRSAAADAELLEVVDKLISEFRGIRGAALMEYEFHVNHESILSVILSIVPLKRRAAVQRALRDLPPTASHTLVRATLNNLGLSKQLVDELDQCCLTDDFDTVRIKLESIFHLSSNRSKVANALKEMNEILTLARAFGVGRKVLFRPALSRHADFFRGGFMFECVRRGRQGDVIAFGGRYDSLLEHFSQTQSRQVFGVGMSVAVDQLAIMVRRYESSLSTKLMTKENEDERSYGFWSPARCDVYVAATAQVDLPQRLSVIGELWRAGIRADLQYDDDRSVEEVLAECIDQNTLFLVLPRANRPFVKVRNVLKRSEEEVPRNELCNFLRQAIAEQRRVDATYASAEGSIPSAQAAALAVTEPRASSGPDIKLVLPPEPQSSSRRDKTRPVRKHRHVTKSVYYDKAAEFATSTGSTLPIIAVDMLPSVLSQMTVDTAWVHDEEAVRPFLANMTVKHDKEYLQAVVMAVRETIAESKKASLSASSGGGGGGGNGWLWLFCVRENRGFLLQSK